MLKRLRIGTRASQLAIKQTHIVLDLLRQVNPGIEFEIKQIVTEGDKILDTSLSKIGGKGLFVKEIDNALLQDKIDLAIHSMKDMPFQIASGLLLGAVLGRQHPYDVLVAPHFKSWIDLPKGAVVGTSSVRREAQLLALRPDLKVRSVRGNVLTRLRKLHDGQFDALILAMAGLIRVDKQDEITQQFTLDEMLPAIGQGALAVQCRDNNSEVQALLSKINEPNLAHAISLERSFMGYFNGGCHLPIAAYATVKGNNVSMSGLVASSNGEVILRESVTGTLQERGLGERLAKALVGQGADRLLDIGDSDE